ncbi:hypothetical protein [Cupriavidus necator]|uniref:hypothetical protein n=1 Tax=Cupriavidus necator TaxID=106590 RepID=UPI0039C1D266
MAGALIGHLKQQPEGLYHQQQLGGSIHSDGNVRPVLGDQGDFHSFTLSQRFALRGTNVRVLEIAPPWVDTNLVYRSRDPRAMQLDPFIAETMAQRHPRQK